MVVHTDAKGQVSKLNGSISHNIELTLLGGEGFGASAQWSADDALDEVIRLNIRQAQLSGKALEYNQKKSQLIIYIDDQGQAHLAYAVDFLYYSGEGDVGKPLWP